MKIKKPSNFHENGPDSLLYFIYGKTVINDI